MRTLTILAALLNAPTALAQDSSQAEQLQRADRLRTLGWIEVGGGAAAMTGGLALMIAGRPSGELVNPDVPEAMHGVRTVTGAVCLLGGFTSMLVGGATLGDAQATRENATLALVPELGPDRNGLRLTGTF